MQRAGKTPSKADDPYANVGRNAPCPCGSGKKFKMSRTAGRRLGHNCRRESGWTITLQIAEDLLMPPRS